MKTLRVKVPMRLMVRLPITSATAPARRREQPHARLSDGQSRALQHGRGMLTSRQGLACDVDKHWVHTRPGMSRRDEPEKKSTVHVNIFAHVFQVDGQHARVHVGNGDRGIQ